MPSQNTIVYADFDDAGPYTSSILARSIAQAARDSLTAGQFNVALRALSVADIQGAMNKFPCGHDRLSLENGLVLLDAGAMLAYAPYCTTILLSGDPFESAERIQHVLGLDIDFIRLRLHDALLSSGKVISLNHSLSEKMAPFLPALAEHKAIPSTALEAGGNAILVVENIDEDLSQDILDSLHDAFPDQEFVQFDAANAFERAWKLVLQLGVARSSVPGARLTDAWAGGVPLLQFVDTASVAMQRRRRPDQMANVVVEHGKTGLRCATQDELEAVLGDLFLDILPARAVARTAKRRADPAGEWNDLLKAVLQ